MPVFKMMEILTKVSIAWGSHTNGTAPWFVILVVRSLMKLMWSYHDYIHAPIWGRGDGRQLEPAAVIGLVEEC